MRAVSSLLLASWLGVVTGARKGGGGGDYGSGDGGSTGGGSGGGACDTTGGYSYCSSIDTLPYWWGTQGCGLGECGCGMLPARQHLYGLPGLYYNGTLTVQHQVKDNAGWVQNGCNRTQGDADLKTNKYPALLFIGPSGNESDTNAIHWSLYGFEPGEDTKNTNAPYVDLYQRWFLVRSSDFVPSGDWCSTNTGVNPFYAYADMSNTVRTRVYWETSVSESGSNTFSADAKLVNLSPSHTDVTYSNGYGYEVNDNKTYVSNYATLRNVCTLSQAYYKTTNYTPTVWFQKGATAKIANIGSEKATLSINNTLDKAPAYQSESVAKCDGNTQVHTGFEFGNYHSNLRPSSDMEDWGLSLSLGLSFEGTLVSENSTQINETRDGKPVFSKTYNRTIKTGQNKDWCGGASRMAGGSESWLLFFAIALLHWALER